jgi:hypothetical protein
LVLKAFSGEKIYDGKPFAESELTKYYLLSGQLMEGHRLEVTVSYSKNATKPGVYRNRIVSYKVYDENGKDVTTEYYNIRCLEGTVTIQKRPITITLGSATRIYDGRPLQCTDYWVSAGSLLPGHVLRLTISDSVTGPGTKEIYPDKVEIFDYSGSTVKLVSDFYEWTIIPAELTILPPE